ncbi:MAG: hypothetical protein ABI811_00950 [Acidobacteriota bacterium]
MRGKKDIQFQSFLFLKCFAMASSMPGNPGMLVTVHACIVRTHVEDADPMGLTPFLDRRGQTHRPLGVSGMQVHRQFGAAEGDLLYVSKKTIHLRRVKAERFDALSRY